MFKLQENENKENAYFSNSLLWISWTTSKVAILGRTNLNT